MIAAVKASNRMMMGWESCYEDNDDMLRGGPEAPRVLGSTTTSLSFGIEDYHHTSEA
jgi:hypothetical protein